MVVIMCYSQKQSKQSFAVSCENFLFLCNRRLPRGNTVCIKFEQNLLIS